MDRETPVFAKLSPDVTDIVAIARACVEAGADGLSLINTLLGMVIDPVTMRPALGGITGGLSGPAIRPVAVRCLWQVHQALPRVPLIGMGGIRTGLDALELVLAGASAVSVGTSDLQRPLGADPGARRAAAGPGRARVHPLRRRRRLRPPGHRRAGHPRHRPDPDPAPAAGLRLGTGPAGQTRPPTRTPGIPPSSTSGRATAGRRTARRPAPGRHARRDRDGTDERASMTSGSARAPAP